MNNLSPFKNSKLKIYVYFACNTKLSLVENNINYFYMKKIDSIILNFI